MPYLDMMMMMQRTTTTTAAKAMMKDDDGNNKDEEQQTVGSIITRKKHHGMLPLLTLFGLAWVSLLLRVNDDSFFTCTEATLCSRLTSSSAKATMKSVSATNTTTTTPIAKTKQEEEMTTTLLPEIVPVVKMTTPASSCKQQQQQQQPQASSRSSLSSSSSSSLFPIPPKHLEISESKNQEWHKHALAWNPRLYEEPNKKWDDLSIGRSCLWEQDNTTFYGGTWVCKDCGNGNGGDNGGTSSGSSSKSCTPLVPRGKCPAPQALMHWDDNYNIYKLNVQLPRRRTYHRIEASKSSSSTSWIAKYWNSGPTQYEIAPCSSNLELPCFDLDRCLSPTSTSTSTSSSGNDDDVPIKVYLHNHDHDTAAAINDNNNNQTSRSSRSISSIQVMERGLKRIQEMIPNIVQVTTNHSEACLFLVARGSFSSHHEMIHNPLYLAGQNHLILNSNLLMGSRGDHPFPYHFNYELAALMSPTLEAGYLRPGYDQVLHLPSVWRRPQKYDSLNLHRPRRLLLSFKGKVLIKNPVPYQAYRWLAAEYWSFNNESSSSSDVYVDVHCGEDRDGLGYELKGLEAYEELLLNSTFVFAPGGNGQSSYRFTEALNADAIPVVMSYVSLPFEPEIDWSGCVVRVAEARIPNVPHMLRGMSKEEIRARRERCRVLYRGVIGRQREETGWTSQSYAKTPLVTALKIWKIRIMTAKTRRKALLELEQGTKEISP